MQSLQPTYEISLLNQGYDCIIGIDEAGRGPWAGPVSISAYIYTRNSQIIDGINDSKLISQKKRNEIFQLITKTQQDFRHHMPSSEFIDKNGIGKTIEQSIQKLINEIHNEYTGLRKIFLIDGYFKSDFGGDHEFRLIKSGDRKYYSIAAASIIAKERRDAAMRKFALKYPEYVFEKHKGYGTKLHRELLIKFGLCPIHRKSYKPVRDLLS